MKRRLFLDAILALVSIFPHELYGDRFPHQPFIEAPESSTIIYHTIDIIAAVIGIGPVNLQNWITKQHHAGQHGFCGIHTLDPLDAVRILRLELYSDIVRHSDITLFGVFDHPREYIWRAFVIGRILVETEATGCPSNSDIFDFIDGPRDMSVRAKAETFALILPRCTDMWSHFSSLAAEYRVPVSQVVLSVAVVAFQTRDAWIQTLMNNNVLSWYSHEPEERNQHLPFHA